MKRGGPLKRGKKLKPGKPLARMSVKRKAELAASGVAFPSSTLRPRAREASTPKMATGKAKRPAQTGFDAATADAILERDGHCCGRCGGALWGDRGFHYSIQHRRARGAGGSLRPDTNAPQNGIALCGSATSAGGCHGHVEAHPAEAEKDGYRVPQDGDPLTVPVTHAMHGVVYLWPNGSWGSRPWKEACA